MAPRRLGLSGHWYKQPARFRWMTNAPFAVFHRGHAHKHNTHTRDALPLHKQWQAYFCEERCDASLPSTRRCAAYILYYICCVIFSVMDSISLHEQEHLTCSTYIYTHKKKRRCRQTQTRDANAKWTGFVYTREHNICKSLTFMWWGNCVMMMKKKFKQCTLAYVGVCFVTVLAGLCPALHKRCTLHIKQQQPNTRNFINIHTNIHI